MHGMIALAKIFTLECVLLYVLVTFKLIFAEKYRKMRQLVPMRQPSNKADIALVFAG